MAHRFFMPSLNLFGEGALKDAGYEMKKLGFYKALIVTDKAMVSSNLIKLLSDVLDENGIIYTIFSDVQPNPTTKNVRYGFDMLIKEKCDFVISFGGGSSHDCAKGIALLATNGGDVKDYAGLNLPENPQLPLVCVNTTAGTAAEMTIFSVITDEKVKMPIISNMLTPVMSVNDPLTMLSKPKALTSATGMDALTHAIEAYISTGASPITDACALKAISMIAENLETAVNMGQDIQARTNMAYASFMAGMAFSNAGLGYVHAMAHQLGGFYDLPHGLCNAVLLPHVLHFNAGAAAEKIAECGRAMGLEEDKANPGKSAEMTVRRIAAMNKAIGIPANLSEIGVREGDLPTLAKNAILDSCAATNPRKATEDEILTIFKAAMF